jgi:hypothetical protein
MVLALALAPLPAQDRRRFEPRPALHYQVRQTSEGVTIGVEVFRGRARIKEAFPKTDLEKVGILPVLVVIANDNDHVVQLDRMRVQLITGDRQAIDPTAAEDVLRSGKVQRPEVAPLPSPIPGIGRGGRSSRNQDQELELSDREFVAPVVGPRSSVHGFFYFRLGKGPDRLKGGKLYLTGIRNARTGQELLYFEIDLDR